MKFNLINFLFVWSVYQLNTCQCYTINQTLITQKHVQGSTLSPPLLPQTQRLHRRHEQHNRQHHQHEHHTSPHSQQTKYTIDYLLNNNFDTRISNDIDMDPCKAGEC